MNTEPTHTPILEVRDASRRFGQVTALDSVSLTVRRGQFVTLLGPSGSGKTTLLRIIGGLEEPTEIAQLLIAGADVRGIPANHRNVATVFQHYGLFPHMSVGENIEYGLRVRRRPADERRRRALEALELMRLPGMYDRRVYQLSGGERQRIALARALVTEPEILLLDEPLGALDERLRQDMQVELLRLQRTLGTTFILVTHSQEEALTMSERIVLLHHGRIVQDGTPQEIFEAPAERFVADFMGVENVLEGRIVAINGGYAQVSIGDRELTGRLVSNARLTAGEPAFFAIRGEKVRLLPGREEVPEGYHRMSCQTRLQVYKGNYYDIELETPIGTLVSQLWEPPALAEDGCVAWRPEDCVIGPIDSRPQ